MLNDIDIEFIMNNRLKPLILPVVNTQIERLEDIVSKLDEISRLISLCREFKIPGIWLYIWNDNGKKKIDFGELWFHEKAKIKEILTTAR